jgi:transcriptional regulator with XRE-family HTH domain
MVIVKGDFMNFIPERLISVRESLNINKAEAARMLNLSAMGYGRYEKGERSYQMVNYIAQTFHTSVDYLYGYSDEMNTRSTIVSEKDEPDLFLLIEFARQDDKLLYRLLEYAKYQSHSDK